MNHPGQPADPKQDDVEKLSPRQREERDRDDRLRALALHKATELTLTDDRTGIGKGALTADRAKVLYAFLAGTSTDTKGGDQ